MRIVTWNVNSLKVRLERVVAWIAKNEPDVALLQETKVADAAFPTPRLRRHRLRDGASRRWTLEWRCDRLTHWS